MIKDKKIGFIGFGKMGSVLLSGLLNINMPKEKVLIADKYKQDEIKKYFGFNALENSEVAQNADVVILAIQPKDVFDVLQDIFPYINNDKLIISIAAGIKVEAMRSILKSKGRLIRVMPNVAALIREAISAIYCGPRTTKEDEKIAVAILSFIGKTVIIKDESLMDSVTGLSGSGPAYIFEVIEALADGGVMVGLNREDALKLAAQTVKGAAELVLQTNKHPAELKDMVASPGGTTIYGLAELEKMGIRGAFIQAVVAATKRSEELGS